MSKQNYVVHIKNLVLPAVWNGVKKHKQMYYISTKIVCETVQRFE